MNVTAPREPRQPSGRWETIRDALDSNQRALRFCLMSIADPVTVVITAELLWHILF